jgi:hypothetical protein
MPKSRGVPLLHGTRSNAKKIYTANNAEKSHAIKEEKHDLKVSIKPITNRRSTLKQIRDTLQNAATAFVSRFTRARNSKIHSANFTRIGGRKRRTKRYTK